jgi:tetratricopeptide (TPR) repeat protein
MDELELYQQMISKDPSSQAFIYLAESLWERKMYAEAIETCSNGLRLHPHDLRARVILGLSYLGAGELDRAETELLKAKEILEINTAIYQALAELYEQKGDSEQAGRYRQLFETIHPSEPVEVEIQPAEEATESVAEGVAEKDPEVATETMAELYVQQGDLEKAVEVYRKLIEAAPEAADAESKLAELQKQIRETQAAHSLLSILESWQSNLQERAATETTSPPSAPASFDPEKLAAIVQKYVKESGSS